MSNRASARPAARNPTTQDQAPLGADWRSGFGTAVLIGVLVLGFVVLTPNIYFGGNWRLALVFVAGYVVVGAAVAWRGSMALKLALSCIILGASGIAAILAAGAPANGTFFFIALITVLTLLSSPRAGAVATAVTIIIIGVLAPLSAAPLPGTQPAGLALGAPAGWIGMALAILLFGVALVLGVGYLRRNGVPGSEATAPAALQPTAVSGEPPARQDEHSNAPDWLRKALEFSRNLGVGSESSELAAGLAQAIHDAFGYPRVQVWTLDESPEHLTLGAEVGGHEGGSLDSTQSLPIDGDALAARAVRLRVLQTSSATGGVGAGQSRGQEGETSVAALPIEHGGHALGCLVVHTLPHARFQTDELLVLEWVAEQAAGFLAPRRISPESAPRPTQTVSPSPAEPLEPWAPPAEQAELDYETGESGLPEGGARMSVPLALRDQEIGSISLSADAEWSAEDRSLVEAVATQAALALENARLMQATQFAAAREHALADITAKVWTSATVDGVLRTAVQELAQALGADRAIIELRMENQSDE